MSLNKPSREIQVSRSNIEAWVETGLRSMGALEDGADVLELQIGNLRTPIINVIYKVKPKELEVEVILHNG